MQVIVPINQRAAIRRGFNADSTVKLEVDVATLTPAQRDRFAAHFDDGRLANGFGALDEPTLAALVQQLDVLAAEVAADKADKEQKALADFAKVKAAPPETRTKSYKADGSETCYDAKVTVSYTHQCSYLGTSCYLPPEAKQEYDAWNARIEAENKARLAAALAEAEPKFAAARAAEARAKSEVVEREAKAKADNAQREASAKSIITTLGSDTQKARLERGLMADPLKEATKLAADDAFRNVPLDVATPPSKDDIDLSKWEEEGGDADYLPEIERDQEKAEALTDEEMAAYLAAEKLILAQVPGFKVEPWLLQITRDHDDIPWHSKAVARATGTHLGLPVTRDFELP